MGQNRIRATEEGEELKKTVTKIENGVPHDKDHEFLSRWYPLDAVATWVDHLSKKGVPFDLVLYPRKRVYMIYKHMQHDKADGTIRACCDRYDPMIEGREHDLLLRPTSRRELGIA